MSGDDVFGYVAMGNGVKDNSALKSSNVLVEGASHKLSYRWRIWEGAAKLRETMSAEVA